MSKVKVLFVVDNFYRAGAERFAYELNKALNKEKFDLSIFCLQKEHIEHNMWKERYYDKMHQDLGTPIKYADNFIDSRFESQLKFINRLKRKVGLFPRSINYWKSKELANYLLQFDVIHWMGEYTYLHFLDDKIRERSLIHIMSARFQSKNLYSKFNHNLHYNFCTPFTEAELHFELEEFKCYNQIFIPLVTETSNKTRQWRFGTSSVFKIGVFTRISSYKPLDPYFYAFHLLLDKLPNCELHIFGQGEPGELVRMIERIGIQDKVFFRGHQEDLVLTALKENLAVSWFQGYKNRPAGYAGIDLCTAGVPLICWDFTNHEKEGNKDEIYPHFQNLSKFVDKTIEILTDSSVAEKLSIAQYEEVKESRDVSTYIDVLENEYIRIANMNIE